MAEGEKVRQLIGRQKKVMENWDKIEECLRSERERDIAVEKRDDFCDIIKKRIDRGETDYIAAIKSLGAEESSIGIAWLQEIVDQIQRECAQFIS